MVFIRRVLGADSFLPSRSRVDRDEPALAAAAAAGVEAPVSSSFGRMRAFLFAATLAFFNPLALVLLLLFVNALPPCGDELAAAATAAAAANSLEDSLIARCSW